MEQTTEQRILEVARALIQTRGQNAFSYADIAQAVGVTKASIHYHYPTKAALVLSIVQDYRQQMAAGIAQHQSRTQDARVLLGAYLAFHGGLAQQGRLCVCLALASESRSLEPAVLEAVQGYFSENLAWLEGLLEGGRRAGELTFRGSAADMAAHVQSTVEGALLLFRAFEAPQRFQKISEGLLESLSL